MPTAEKMCSTRVWVAKYSENFGQRNRSFLLTQLYRSDKISNHTIITCDMWTCDIYLHDLINETSLGGQRSWWVGQTSPSELLCRQCAITEIISRSLPWIMSSLSSHWTTMNPVSHLTSRTRARASHTHICTTHSKRNFDIRAYCIIGRQGKMKSPI